jgi:hypothetical protein
MTHYDEFGRRGEEDEYGDIKWEKPYQVSLIPVFELPTFQPVRGGILGMLLGWLLFPFVFLIGMAYLALVVEIMLTGVMPYLVFCTNMAGEHFNYHPIIGVAASFVGIYTLILINCFWFTAYPYSIFSSLNWLIGIFNSTNTKNKINSDSWLIFTDPANMFNQILYSLKNGTNVWAICAFFSMLLVHISFHVYVNTAYKSLSFRQRRQAFISSIYLAVFLSLIIGGLISLTWK